MFLLNCLSQDTRGHGATSELGVSTAKLADELHTWAYSLTAVIIPDIKNIRNYSRTAGFGFVIDSLVQSIVVSAVHAPATTAEEEKLIATAYAAANKEVGAAAAVDAAAAVLRVAIDADDSPSYEAKFAEADAAYEAVVATGIRYKAASDAALDAATGWQSATPIIGELGADYVIDCSAFMTGRYLLPLNVTVVQHVYILTCITKASREVDIKTEIGVTVTEFGTIVTALAAQLNSWAYSRTGDILPAIKNLISYGRNAGIGGAVDSLAESIVVSANAAPATAK